MPQSRRIGIMGLKADPPHWQHLLVGQQAYSQFALDEVHFVPAGQPVDKPHITHKETRYRMVCAALEDHPHLIPSRVEIDRAGPSYTVDTLRHFNETYGRDAELFLIIGDDRAETFHEWHHSEEIIELATLLVSCRSEFAVDRQWLSDVLPRGTRFGTIAWEVSSTFIREQISHGMSTRFLLPDKVAQIIADQNLYHDETSEPLSQSDGIKTARGLLAG